MELPDVDLSDWFLFRLAAPPEHYTTMLRAIGDDARRRRKT